VVVGWAVVDEVLLRSGRDTTIVENDILQALNNVVDLIIGQGSFRR